MAYKTYKPVDRKATPQNQVIPGREAEMKVNNEGAYVFSTGIWKYLLRFLILGTEGGTYYASEQDITKANVKNVEACIKEDGPRVVRTVVEVSESGRAPKNDPALFVLAKCSAADDPATRKAALEALPRVARIGTHLFHYAGYVDGLRGWGRGLRNAVATWYNQMPLNQLINQVTKYQQRDGWSHRDLLRLAHPRTEDTTRNNLYKYVVDGWDGSFPTDGLEYVWAVEELKKANESQVLEAISKYRLPMEVIPTDKRSVEVYRAVMPTAGLTWLFRNLGNLGKHGILVQKNFNEVNLVVDRLTNAENIKRSRVHPIQVLSALMTYSRGAGFRGDGRWDAVPAVVNALNDAFFASFGNVEPTGKRIMIGLDISSSMTGGEIAGVPGLTPRQASAAMCMVHAAAERNLLIKGFHHDLIDLAINPRDRIEKVCDYLNRLGFGATDCSLPMAWAHRNKAEVDAFIIYTDNETGSARFSWNGQSRSHPSQTLVQYRQRFVSDAKLIAVGMTATDSTIADPKDPGMLDVVGFDSAAPQLINDFILGRV